MGVFDFLLGSRRAKAKETTVRPADKPPVKISVGAKPDETEEQIFQSFNNSNITFSGELSGYDYDSILRDKQANIVSLYQLADYYVDVDPLVRGIVKHMYLPYTLSSQWFLTGTNEKTNKIYESFYKKIRLREKLDSIVYEYWKYSNVFVYIHHGVPLTLPPNKCKIGNISINGEPIVDFDCQSILNEWRAKSYTIKENWIKDNHLEDYFVGFPDEIRDAMNKGEQYAQLNPKYMKVLQGAKESWQRYSIPFIATCLPALAKKELISKYENSVLNLGIRSFVQVNYGDKTKGWDMLPDQAQLQAVRSVYSRAMSGFPLAVINQLGDAKVIQPKLDDLFQFDKYSNVNNDILSAGGVSGILVTGVSQDGSTFASAQVSMQTAAARIESAREEICELMNKINVCIQEELSLTHAYNVSKVPEFNFAPLDMAGKKALREACQSLWQQGLVSTKTLMTMNGYSLDKEKEQRELESTDGTDAILVPREIVNAKNSAQVQNTQDNQETPVKTEDEKEETKSDRGRPELDNEERNSDPDAAMRGKQPKPSNPEGSMNDSEIT